MDSDHKVGFGTVYHESTAVADLLWDPAVMLSLTESENKEDLQ
jgi:hypothetical protein